MKKTNFYVAPQIKVYEIVTGSEVMGIGDDSTYEQNSKGFIDDDDDDDGVVTSGGSVWDD